MKSFPGRRQRSLARVASALGCHVLAPSGGKAHIERRVEPPAGCSAVRRQLSGAVHLLFPELFGIAVRPEFGKGPQVQKQRKLCNRYNRSACLKIRSVRIRQAFPVLARAKLSMGNEFEKATSPIFHTTLKILVFPTRQAVPRRHRKLASRRHKQPKLGSTW